VKRAVSPFLMKTDQSFIRTNKKEAQNLIEFGPLG
jgi:hypothetical protein